MNPFTNKSIVTQPHGATYTVLILDNNQSVEFFDYQIRPTDAIQEVKKVGGLGWKGRIVVGWATDREVKDGIVIVDKSGKEYRVTALKERDELFNRLIAIGNQVWESW